MKKGICIVTACIGVLTAVPAFAAPDTPAATPDYLAMAFAVIGGLGIFLLGMKNMSEGLQAVAGSRLRAMINAVTDNRLLGVGVGTGVTCLVQSSSITTVIVIGLVNSGLMALHQAIGVIMGANIGTTITGWILVLKIGKWGLPILGVAVFFYLFSRRDTWRYVAMGVMGLGMVFFGLELMKNGFKPMKEVPMFEQAFAWFVADSYLGVLKCALVGCLLTFLVQSSSATLGITIGLASTGAIPFQTAAALVLGENIGTTITAWLASIGATTNAKRAAYAHVMFNLIGVIWITAIFSIYIVLVDKIVNLQMGAGPLDITLENAKFEQIVTAGIAATHTGFNVINTLIFLPFVKPFARFLQRFVPDKAVKESPHLQLFDTPRLVESPVLGIEASRREILKMAGGVEKMLAWTRKIMEKPEPNEPLVQKVFHREAVLDNVEQEVIDFLTELMTGQVPHAVTVEGRQQLRIVDEYESISDYVSNVLKAHLRIVNEGLTLSEAQRAGVTELHDEVVRYVKMITKAFEAGQGDIIGKATTQGRAITHEAKELRNAHIDRMTETKIAPILSMSYTSMLNAYRKIKDHALNIAEALDDHHGHAH